MQAQQVLRSRAWISQLHFRMKFLPKFGRNVESRIVDRDSQTGFLTKLFICELRVLYSLHARPECDPQSIIMFLNFHTKMMYFTSKFQLKYALIITPALPRLLCEKKSHVES